MLKVGLPYDYGSSAFVCLVPFPDVHFVCAFNVGPVALVSKRKPASLTFKSYCLLPRQVIS
jgi:hypothetical protein